MKIQPIYFATPVYYSKENFLADAAVLDGFIRGLDDSPADVAPALYVHSRQELAAFLAARPDVLPLVVACSGGTQKWILEAVKAYGQALLWIYYPNDSIYSEGTAAAVTAVMARNAMPAVVDTWAHLRNRGLAVEKVFDRASYAAEKGLFAALAAIRRARLLVVGYTQQWVVSASVDQRKIEDKFGIQTVHIGLEELLAEFAKTPATPAGAEFARRYLAGAKSCVEPSAAQVEDAYRMYLALSALLNRYECDSLAISCFSLVANTGVTSCLALSLLNDAPGTVAACEGDLDAAVSMIIGKKLTGRPVFMGNPVFNRDDTLDLVHCTAPRALLGGVQPYEVRSHHETGKSVAQRIEVAAGQTATIFRVGNEFAEATLYTAALVDNPRLDTCRTQFRFKIDSSDRRFEELLGCHQLVVFGDHEAKLRRALTKYLGVAVR